MPEIKPENSFWRQRQSNARNVMIRSESYIILIAIAKTKMAKYFGIMNFNATTTFL